MDVKNRILVCDIETSGFSPSENVIIEIGYAEIIDMELMNVDVISVEERLGLSGRKVIQKLRGIDPGPNWPGIPRNTAAGMFQDIVKKFFLDTDYFQWNLSAFNASFEKKFMTRAPWSIPGLGWRRELDIMFMAMKRMEKDGALEWNSYRRDWKWPKLSEALAWAKLENEAEHTALGDVKAEAELLLHLMRLKEDVHD